VSPGGYLHLVKPGHCRVGKEGKGETFEVGADRKRKEGSVENKRTNANLFGGGKRTIGSNQLKGSLKEKKKTIRKNYTGDEKSVGNLRGK